MFAGQFRDWFLRGFQSEWDFFWNVQEIVYAVDSRGLSACAAP